MMKRLVVRAFALVVALSAAAGTADAAEINAFVSTAIKAATDELLPPFERANGYTIRASYAPSGALIPRFIAGEPVDVFLTDSTAIDALIKQGKIVGGRTDLARTGIGIAVRKLAAGGPNGRVSVLVSSGEAEIGLQQVSELMSNPAVEVIGMLPAELQLITIYSAGVTTSAREAEAAKALIKALTAPSAAVIYKAKGLDPPRDPP